jgi:hypothetical protein
VKVVDKVSKVKSWCFYVWFYDDLRCLINILWC